MDEQTQMTGAEQGSAAVDPDEQALNPDEEITEIEKLLSTEPDDFQARCRLGELYFSKGRLDDALTEVKKSIEMAEGLQDGNDTGLLRCIIRSNLGPILPQKE